MAAQRYSVALHVIEALPAWVRSGEIAFPEIQQYGGITGAAQMRANLRRSFVPDNLLHGDVPDYADFLERRRVRMAWKTQTYFGGL